MANRIPQRPKDDPSLERFMEYFYKHCVDVLFHPLLDLPEFKNVTGECILFSRDDRYPISNIPESTLTLSRERTNLYLHLCDLLASFALQHSFRSHFYMLSSSISSHVATLLRAKDKHVRLGMHNHFY
jgi:protein phosphatase 4 regulatory subunit 3